MGNCFNFFTEMPTEKYAEMLARTTRTETQNIAMIGKALDDGNDLVECSTVTPTCDLCALYQGRIYSVSGRTPGYPSLYETAFKHGYSIIHPNCRHQFFPYNPKFHTEAERQALEEGTRRPWIGGQQGEAARAEYAKSQMQMRRWNKELNEFAQMKQRFGDNAPYKTLGAFRRAYRSQEGTLSYAKSHYYKRDKKEYDEFEEVVGKENMSETLEKFQELKYNKDEKVRREIILLSREVRLKQKSFGQPKLPNYDNAVISDNKTKNYLLNPESERGKDKAYVIKSVLGYEREDYNEFAAQIYKNLPYYEAIPTKTTEYGISFDVNMVLLGKNGRRLEVTTAWQIDKGKKFPRFITLTFPKKKKV